MIKVYNYYALTFYKGFIYKSFITTDLDEVNKYFDNYEKTDIQFDQNAVCISFCAGELLKTKNTKTIRGFNVILRVYKRLSHNRPIVTKKTFLEEISYRAARMQVSISIRYAWIYFTTFCSVVFRKLKFWK